MGDEEEAVEKVIGTIQIVEEVIGTIQIVEEVIGTIMVVEEVIVTTHVEEEVVITRIEEVMGKTKLKTTTKARYNVIIAKNMGIMLPNVMISSVTIFWYVIFVTNQYMD